MPRAAVRPPLPVPARPLTRNPLFWLALLGGAVALLLVSGRHRHLPASPLGGGIAPAPVQVPIRGPLPQRLTQAIEAAVARHEVERVGLVWQDLSSGETLAYQADQRFRSASLLKVPLLMAWLKKAQGDPEVLDQRLTWPTGAHDGRERLDAPGALAAGQAYSVADLIERVAIHSRNDARFLLKQALPAGELERAYALLGIDVQVDAAQDNHVTTADMAKLLLALHQATYLDRKHSDRLLDLLARSTYRDGLVRGLPAGTRVAHKYGVRVDRQALPGKAETQLHDCGIVGSGEKAYLLCVMTAGRDLQRQATVLARLATEAHAGR